MKRIKNFKTYIINENNTEGGFMEFVKNLVNDCRILSPEEYIEILKENKEILNDFYNKFKEEPRSIVIYINSEIKRLLGYFSVSDLLNEFSKKDSLKSILDKYEEHRKKMPDSMRYLKTFEGLQYTDIKVSEANKIKSLPGFNFTRTESFFGYNLIGKRIELPMERIEISKDVDNFILNIRRKPGYFRDMTPAGDTGWEEDWSKERDWEFKFTFDDIESLMKFLVDYEWYDKLN